MGLKIGLVAFAEKEGLYIKLKKDGTHPSEYARVFKTADAPHLFELHYADGSVAQLKLNQEKQLVVSLVLLNVMPPHSKPTADQIVFSGEYEAQEISACLLEDPPPVIHRDLSDRFRLPKTLWEKTVARSLGYSQ